MPFMDKCGGHGVNIAYGRIKVLSLPRKGATKHQPVDLGMTADAKIRYQSTLLRSVLSFMAIHRLTKKQFLTVLSNMYNGIREGQKPDL